MKYYEDVRELIGHTPLVKLNRMGFAAGRNIFAKLELMNPGGSVKDRMGTALVKDAEESGVLKPGCTILEATAGNAGIGITLAALGKGYRVVFAVPEKFSEEKQTIMKAYGAEIVHTPLEKGMQGAMEKVEELKQSVPHPVTLSQFSNPANPLAHYRTTGPEIFDDLDGKVDYLVAGAGSGGTLAGAAKYLKERKSSVKVIMADPFGSTMGGGEPGCYAIEGIGNTFMPATMDMSLVDLVYKITDAEAIGELRRLAAEEGILAGTSSGAALSAARKAAGDAPEGSNLVVVFPDRGDRYFSKHIYGKGDSAMIARMCGAPFAGGENLEGCQKIRVDLKNVPETLLLPLWSRAEASKMKDPVLKDGMAARLVGRLDYDFSKFRAGLRRFQILVMAIRAKEFDSIIRDFIGEHPRATIVNIGAGLDTTFRRVDNGKIRWYDLDVPQVIRLRSELLPQEGQTGFIPKFMLDESFFDDIQAPPDGILFLAGGVLMYFAEAEVKSFIGLLSSHYPDGEIVFDTISPSGIRMASRMVRKSGINGASMRWGIWNAKEMKDWIPPVRLLERYPIGARTQAFPSWGVSAWFLLRLNDLFSLINVNRAGLS